MFKDTQNRAQQRIEVWPRSEFVNYFSTPPEAARTEALERLNELETFGELANAIVAHIEFAEVPQLADTWWNSFEIIAIELQDLKPAHLTQFVLGELDKPIPC